MSIVQHSVVWLSNFCLTTFNFVPIIMSSLPLCLLLCRYCQLEEPASYRKEQLYNSLKLHQFYHDVEDELSWINDRRPIAASEELGHNLTEVQNLLHKHQVIELHV